MVPVGARLLALGATALLFGLAACDGRMPASGPTTGSEQATTTPTPTGPSAALTITVDLGRGGSTTTWRLTCHPVGGNHPDPVGACEALDVNGESALPPVPRDRACTMIYGGPERATVTGTRDGKKVSSTFTRTNGCEINRWSQMVPLLPEPMS